MRVRSQRRTPGPEPKSVESGSESQASETKPNDELS